MKRQKFSKSINWTKGLIKTLSKGCQEKSLSLSKAKDYSPGAWREINEAKGLKAKCKNFKCAECGVIKHGVSWRDRQLMLVDSWGYVECPVNVGNKVRYVALCDACFGDSDCISCNPCPICKKGIKK